MDEALDLVERLRVERFAVAVRQDEAGVTRLTQLLEKSLDRYERRWKAAVCR